ncbi:MAG: DUF4304 domain-containing protein [Inhella sp.]
MASKELKCPAPEDKAGAKIDYLAKRLGQALAPHGFTRKSRTVYREQGEGVQRHWQIVNLQAGSWNEGPRGEFYVNLALQFPAIERLQAQRPGQAWRLEHLEQVDECHGHLRARLDALLPADHALARSEYKLGRDTDLPALAERFEAALSAFVLPWFERHARVEALRDFEGSLASADIPLRITAALALQDRTGAERLLAAHPGRWQHLSASFVQELRAWLDSQGLDTSALAPACAPRPPDAWTQRQQAREAAECAAHQQQAERLLAATDPQAPDPDSLAAAWVAEWQARWRENPKTLQDLPSGARIAALDGPGREAVLLALLHALATQEAGAHRHPIQASAKDFEGDEAAAALLKALLPQLGPLQQPEPLFAALQTLQTRLQQDMVTAQYPWGFATLAAWLERQPRCAALQQGVAAWLAQLPHTVLARWDATEAALAAARAQPLDPNSSLYEFLKDSRERMDELQAQAPPVDPADVRRRLREYPEQSLAPADKAAVRSWRRWLRRDPVTGLLPVQFEPDDFGGPAQAAWDSAPPALKTAAAPVVQHWLEGVPTKPSQRWLGELRARIDGFDAAQQQPWRAWVRERLAAFAQSSGRTEWATTGARPGVDARLGECSEDLLLGLLWWSALDPELHDAPWQAVATAAFERLPEVGARALAVGALALRLLAGRGGAAAEWVATQAKAKGAKQLAKAAEKALAEPWLNPA